METTKNKKRIPKLLLGFLRYIGKYKNLNNVRYRREVRGKKVWVATFSGQTFLTWFVIFCLITPLSFSRNQRFITNIYSSYLKGLFYIENGEYLLGLKELEKVKAKDPQSVHIRLKIATVLTRLERVNEAEKILKETKKIDPDNLDVSLALIFIYSYTRQNRKLEEEYENFLKKAYEAKPDNAGVAEYLAQFYFYKKKYQEAIKIYEKILENNPDNIKVLFWLGYLYEEVDRSDEAISTWIRGIEVDSSYAPILNSLGYIYAETGVKLDDAERMIKKALEKEPENGAYLDSLGWVYFKKGDLKKAEEYLDKAIERIKDPDVYKHLGDLHVKIGDINKGVDYYKKGFMCFPDNKSLKSKIEKYEKKDKILKK